MTEQEVADLLRAKLSEIDARVSAMLELRTVLETRLSAVYPLGLGAL